MVTIKLDFAYLSNFNYNAEIVKQIGFLSDLERFLFFELIHVHLPDLTSRFDCTIIARYEQPIRLINRVIILQNEKGGTP